MNRQAIAAMAILLGACASPGPASDAGAPPAADAATAAIDAEPATAGAPADDTGAVIEALPVENATPSEAAAIPVAAEPRPVVCRMERRTGTNRKVKVCRRPQSALDQAETRQTFDSLRRSQMGEPR